MSPALLLLLAYVAAGEAAPVDLGPGLKAVYRSLDRKGPRIDQVDARPAFTWGRSSPHPGLPAGRFEVAWTGLLELPDPDDIVFDAFVGGELRLEVAGQTYLQGRGGNAAASVHLRGGRALALPAGPHPIRVVFRSLAGVPARIQLGWEGKTFSREPLPPWRLKHATTPTSGSARRAEQIARGRVAVERRGCARCHAAAFPGVEVPPPGPSLADIGRRASRAWILEWLGGPHEVRNGPVMPALFRDDRRGLVERSIVADHLVRTTSAGRPREIGARSEAGRGNIRHGRQSFMTSGCVGCHLVPDLDRTAQADLGRSPLQGLGDRFFEEDLASFILDPQRRYPDGRMPRTSIGATAARDIAAYLLLWSKAKETAAPDPAVTAGEIALVARTLGVKGADAAGAALVERARCASCHAGVGQQRPVNRPIRARQAGCLGGATLPRFALATDERTDIEAFLAVSPRETHTSPFFARQQRLRRAGCQQCHARDSDRPSPVEVAASTLDGSKFLPFLRVPRLTDALAKYTRTYLVEAVRDGGMRTRYEGYPCRMPSFGADAAALLDALAEGEGALPGRAEPADPAGTTAMKSFDPTLAGAGFSLVGFEGYSCVSCHLWDGKQLHEPDPSAVGPEMTTMTGRIRRAWFDRWLEGPDRIQPGAPMPQIFQKGHPATLETVLGGDSAQQRDALWAYLGQGKEAASPRPLSPIPVTAPASGRPPLVAQIPVTLLDRKKIVESLCVLYPTHDLVVYDLAAMRLGALYTGARILRQGRGVSRIFSIEGTPVRLDERTSPAARFTGYDRLTDGVRIRTEGPPQRLRLASRTVVWETGGTARTVVLPPARTPPALDVPVLPETGAPEGALERPGYRAIAYPRPKTVTGEDLVMPGAIAVHPVDGRVFVASVKQGELFVLRDPADNGKGARFEDFTGGLFQDAYAMLSEPDGLYVLHRRNLTRVVEENGQAVRFDRVALLSHGIAETYDLAYGLVRDRTGAFVLSYARYANGEIPGSGSMLRLIPGTPPRWEEVAFGFRNPLGWSTGPEGEIFFTDNQGEWVATNKLSHVVKDRYYGSPNPQQMQHTQKPRANAAVWVPYGWARSINGVTFDRTGGKFGPFAGQFFLAELMYGGAIIRAQVEKVNGEYQGAAFPFWGKGLLGPLTMAFDPRGRLWVGSITEPDWMAQPDRGALYRIDFTGETPFEIQELHVLPRGFRVLFTLPVDPETATTTTSYALEHWRYEYTGAYGSPELDRTAVAVQSAQLGADRRTVDLTTASLVKDRVYKIAAAGVKSMRGEAPVHPAGVYTLNEIPR